MHNAAMENYLVTAVMTATPQKLHLMLIDAAIRACQCAQNHCQNKENEQAGKYILRAQRIVSGILTGIDYDAKSELVGKVAGVYLFVYRSLARAFIDNDVDKLVEALRVLSVERETWRQVCDKIATSTSPQISAKTGHPPIAPNLPFNSENISEAISSLSLEA